MLISIAVLGKGLILDFRREICKTGDEMETLHFDGLDFDANQRRLLFHALQAIPSVGVQLFLDFQYKEVLAGYFKRFY